MNRLEVQYTKFTDLNEQGDEMNSYYGVQLVDDLNKVCDDRFDNFQHLKNEVNLSTILKYLLEREDDYIVVVQDKGLQFNGKWYDIEEIVELSPNLSAMEIGLFITGDNKTRKK